MTSSSEEHLTSLYRLHSARVLAYALRRAIPDDAEEIVAETFTIAWRRLSEVPHDALPWLLGVARRVLANQRRSRRRLLELRDRLAAEPPDRASEPLDPAESAEERAVMHRALSHLDERDREALLLVAWDGLDNRRAARVLGCSPATFAVRLHRARKRLARSLASDLRSDAPVNAIPVCKEAR